jgi:hypothetical protein
VGGQDGVGGYGSGGATVRGEGAGRAKARAKNQSMGLSYFHIFLASFSHECA